jgi:dihydrofolate reductase
MNPKISAIAAMDSKRGIGKDNQLLFKIPEDFKRMKELTFGHPIIMGRKTFESIGRVLSGRTNIIITRDATYEVPGAIICHSLEEAIKTAKERDPEEIFIFGGAQVFEEALPLIDRLYLTLVEGDFHADTFFPEYEPFFKKVLVEKHGESDSLKYKFLDLER